MNPETRPLFLRCTADGKRFLMTTNSEPSEGEFALVTIVRNWAAGLKNRRDVTGKTNLQLASGAFSSKVAPFTPAGERTKKAPSRGGRTGSNGQQHPVVIDCEVLRKRASGRASSPVLSRRRHAAMDTPRSTRGRQRCSAIWRWHAPTEVSVICSGDCAGSMFW